MSYTLTELAERLATLSGRDTEAVYNQLRNPTVKRALRPLSGDGRRTLATRYGDESVVAVMVVWRLAEIGLDASVGEDVADALFKVIDSGGDAPPSALEREGYVVYPSALESARRGVSKGEAWELRIELRQSESGRRQARVKVAWAEWPHYRYDPLIEMSGSAGGRILGELTIPLNPIVALVVSQG